MSMWERIKGIMNIPDEDEDDEETTAEQPKSSDAEEDTYTPKRTERPEREREPRIIKSKTVNYNPQQGKMQVVLVKPDRYDDVTDIADHLNDKKTVILNLEAANRDVSRRIIDFLSGVAYANKGNIRKVANSTFIIVAHDIDVMGEVLLEDYEEGKLYF